MLGLQGRKKKKRGLSLEHSSQTATGGKQLFACCFTSRGQRVRRLQSRELNGAAAECGHVTSRLHSPANAMKIQITATVETRMQRFPLAVLLRDVQHPTEALLKIDAFWFFGRF